MLSGKLLTNSESITEKTKSTLSPTNIKQVSAVHVDFFFFLNFFYFKSNWWTLLCTFKGILLLNSLLLRSDGYPYRLGGFGCFFIYIITKIQCKTSRGLFQLYGSMNNRKAAMTKRWWNTTTAVSSVWHHVIDNCGLELDELQVLPNPNHCMILICCTVGKTLYIK